MEIFIDTSAFCAAVNSLDPNNHRVKQILQTLETAKAILTTSNFVLDETITLIGARVNHSAAVQFIKGFKQSKIAVRRVNEEIEESAEKIFIKYKDKRFSFTDCTSFALIDLYKISGILSLKYSLPQERLHLWQYRQVNANTYHNQNQQNDEIANERLRAAHFFDLLGSNRDQTIYTPATIHANGKPGAAHGHQVLGLAYQARRHRGFRPSRSRRGFVR